MAKTELTDARRERVRELFGKPDRWIADALLEEGFFGPTKRTKDAQITQRETARRTVERDRAWWREHWKKPRTVTVQDMNVSSEEYIARLETRIADLQTILDNPQTKSTAAVNAVSEIRQLEQAIAKARGVEQAVDKAPEQDSGPSVPFIGLVLDVSKVPQHLLKKDPDDDDGSDEQ
jgi:hypothetical protein